MIRFVHCTYYITSRVKFVNFVRKKFEGFANTFLPGLFNNIFLFHDFSVFNPYFHPLEGVVAKNKPSAFEKAADFTYMVLAWRIKLKVE